MNGASGAKNKLQVAERQKIYRAETFRDWVNKVDGTFSAPRTALEEPPDVSTSRNMIENN